MSGCRPAGVAVDGAGKTTFANKLADAIRALQRSVICASVFYNARAVRFERDRYSPEGDERQAYW
jgi:uridine kinase